MSVLLARDARQLVASYEPTKIKMLLAKIYEEITIVASKAKTTVRYSLSDHREKEIRNEVIKVLRTNGFTVVENSNFIIIDWSNNGEEG